MSELQIPRSAVVIGHSRLITNGQSDNQPVVREDIAIVHNGIITNDDEYWRVSQQKRFFVIDTEAILGVAVRLIEKISRLMSFLMRQVVTERCLLMCGTVSSPGKTRPHVEYW